MALVRAGRRGVVELLERHVLDRLCRRCESRGRILRPEHGLFVGHRVFVGRRSGGSAGHVAGGQVWHSDCGVCFNTFIYYHAGVLDFLWCCL